MDIFSYFKINGEQVFFPKYAISIVIMGVTLALIGITIGAVLERFMPKFDPEKPDYHLIFEICVQISLVLVLTYLCREILGKTLRWLFAKHIFGSPDKYAVLVVAPTMFSQQISLVDKINKVWEDIRGDATKESMVTIY